MRLTVLGCAGSFPGPDSPCSAYLLEAEGFRLLLDFGTGSLSGLQRYASLTSVDAILLTHLHAITFWTRSATWWYADMLRTARTPRYLSTPQPAPPSG